MVVKKVRRRPWFPKPRRVEMGRTSPPSHGSKLNFCGDLFNLSSEMERIVSQTSHRKAWLRANEWAGVELKSLPLGRV